MSYIDQQMVLDSSVTKTSTAVTTSAYGLGVAPDGSVADPSIGEPICVVYTVEADPTYTNETYQFQAVAASATNLTSDQKVLVSSMAFTGDTLLAGTKVALTLPSGCLKQAQKGVTNILAFLGGKEVLAGSSPSIKFSAVIQPLSQVQSEAQFSKNYIIL